MTATRPPQRARPHKPRLLSINNYNYRRGGAEVVYAEHNRLLNGAGWNVSNFAMRHEKNDPDPNDDLFVEEIEFGNTYGLKQKLINASRVIYSFEARRKIARMIERTRPDVAHAHNVYHHISPAIFPELRKAGVPTVLTLHDLKLACPAYTMRVNNAVCERCKGGRIHNVVLNRCIKGSLPLSAMIMFETALHRTLRIYDNNVDRFVVPSRFLIDKLVEWGWQRDRFTYIPNIVDATQHAFDDQPARRFVYFGRLSHEKGLDTLIEAAAIARVAVALVGSGQQEAELRALAKAKNADVEFLGYQSGTDLHNAIHDSRAVVIPSTWYENAPVSILEAYALGRPVIGANIGGIPEAIRHGETGEIFTPGNIAELTEALRRFAGMPDAKIAQMGRAGRAWVEQDFSPERYINAISNLYSELGAPAPRLADPIGIKAS
ncbi:MAG: glycosyltransferase family 4 protein [Pseudomonadota bacterium]